MSLFAGVLPRDAVCIFYLVLRALDTVEDDVTIAADVKSTMLRNFHTYLLDPDWKYMGSTETDRIVLEDFPVVCLSFFSLLLHVWYFFQVVITYCQHISGFKNVFFDKSPTRRVYRVWGFILFIVGFFGRVLLDQPACTLEILQSTTTVSAGNKDQFPIQGIILHNVITAPAVWNSLSPVTKSSANITTFKAHLKTELFSATYVTV